MEGLPQLLHSDLQRDGAARRVVLFARFRRGRAGAMARTEGSTANRQDSSSGNAHQILLLGGRRDGGGGGLSPSRL